MDGEGQPGREGVRGWLRHHWVWLVGACLLAGGAYVFYYHSPAAQPPGKKKGDQASRVIPVVAEQVKAGDIKVYLNGLGTVTPTRTVTVRSRVDGELIRVLFTEGQVVKSGQVLAEIDPRPFQVQLAQAEGQMARDRALLENARIDLDRYRKLLKQDSIAEQQVASQESLVRQYEGTVKIDQSQIDNARLQITYSRITAPIGGRIGLRQVDPGNIVRAADTNGLAVITQLQPITVIFTIPQDNLPAVLKRVQSGERLPVEAYDRDQKTRLASGTLLTVDNQIDTTTGTVRLKAEFANDDAVLFPNQFVNIRLLVDTLQGVTTVPTAAILRGAQGIFVYVVNSDQTVTVRSVKLGATEGANSAVDAGLKSGELVVVDGTDRLREGARVELSSREAGKPPAFSDSGKKKGGGRRKKGGDEGAEKNGEKAGEKATGNDSSADKGGERRWKKKATE
jgi:membrane fusion protein, multidrug efflux system